MFDFKDNAVLVTGAGAGIGLGIAQAFHQGGHVSPSAICKIGRAHV